MHKNKVQKERLLFNFLIKKTARDELDELDEARAGGLSLIGFATSQVLDGFFLLVRLQKQNVNLIK